MSDPIYSVSEGGGAYYSTLSSMIGNAKSSQSTVDSLLEQESSGYISNSYSGLGSGSKIALDLSAEIEHETVWTTNIGTADSRLQQTQTTLTEIGTIASSLYAQLNDLNGLDPSSVDTIAAQARDTLQQFAGLLDSQDGTAYIFAGQDSSDPPIANPDNILSSSFFQTIQTEVQGLGSDASPVVSATLATAAPNSAQSPFSAALTSGTVSRSTIAITNNQVATIGVLANQNGNVTSTGTSTTGSYMLDIMRALATVGSLSSSQVTQGGFTGLIQDTRTSLNGAMTALNDEQGIMGASQDQIDSTGTILSQTKVALSSQLSDVQDADMATVATNLQAAQTQLQASYKLIAMAGTLSLVNYI